MYILCPYALLTKLFFHLDCANQKATVIKYFIDLLLV